MFFLTLQLCRFIFLYKISHCINCIIKEPLMTKVTCFRLHNQNFLFHWFHQQSVPNCNMYARTAKSCYIAVTAIFIELFTEPRKWIWNFKLRTLGTHLFIEYLVVHFKRHKVNSRNRYIPVFWINASAAASLKNPSFIRSLKFCASLDSIIVFTPCYKSSSMN